MKKNKSKIISLFSLSLLAFLQTACGSGCDDGLDVDAIALDDKYIINYSREVNEGRVDPSIKAYALTKRGVIDSGNPFNNDSNTMDEITTALEKLNTAGVPHAGSLRNQLILVPAGDFTVIKSSFVNAADSSANAATLQGHVKTLVEKRYPAGAATDLKNFLDTACPTTLSQELQQKCQSTKAILSELLETVYGKSSLLTLELYKQQFKDKTNELNKEIEDLKNIIDFAAQDADQKAAVKNWSDLKVGAKLLSEYGLEISKSPLAHTSLDKYKNEIQTNLATLKAAMPAAPNPLNVTTAGKIANIENSLSQMTTWLVKFKNDEESIKDPIGASANFKVFVKKVFSKAPALVLAKNVEIDGDTDVENVKKFFEGSSKQKLFIKDDDASSTNLSLALAAAIHNDQRSNLGDVYAFNVPNIVSAAKNYGIELSDDVEKFVISIIRRSSAELAAKSANNIIFVIKIDDFSGIDTKKVIETLENNSNILIFASNSAQEALGSALGTSINSYYLAGLSAPEAFIVAQAKAQSLNAARAVKLSPVAVNIIADTTAKLLVGLSPKEATLKLVIDAVSNTFSSLSGANPNDETVKQKVITALAFNTAEVNNSGVLTADLKAVQTLGRAYFQKQAKKGPNNLIYKAAKIAQGETIVAAVKKQEQAKEDKKESQTKVAVLDTEWADYKDAVNGQLVALDINQAVTDYQKEVEDARVYANNVLNSMYTVAGNDFFINGKAVINLTGDITNSLGKARVNNLIKDNGDGKFTLDESKSKSSIQTNGFFEDVGDQDKIQQTILNAQTKAKDIVKKQREWSNNVVKYLTTDSLLKADYSLFTENNLNVTDIDTKLSKDFFKKQLNIELFKYEDTAGTEYNVRTNRRIWAWFFSQIAGEIKDDTLIPNSSTNLYLPGDLFANDTVFVERIKTATATFEQKAKVYLAGQYGLKIVGEYYNILKALYDKNTVAEIAAQRAIPANAALASLFDNMRGVIRGADVANLRIPNPVAMPAETLMGTIGQYYFDGVNTFADIIGAGFCPAAGGVVATVKDGTNPATLKKLKIDGDVAKSTTKICTNKLLLEKTFTP